VLVPTTRKAKIMKKTLCGVALGAGLILVGGGVAAAGAPDSNAERGNGLSICTFSGQNDDPEEGGRVQSYGQLVKVYGVEALTAEGETPALLCNPNGFFGDIFGSEPPWHVTPRKGGGKG
jgi:hypothetical protein